MKTRCRHLRREEAPLGLEATAKLVTARNGKEFEIEMCNLCSGHALDFFLMLEGNEDVISKFVGRP